MHSGLPNQIKGYLLITVTFFGICFYPIQAYSLQACPKYVKPDNPRITHSHYGEYRPPGKGIPLDTPILVERWNADKSEKWRFRVPLGFRIGWTNTGTPKEFDVNRVDSGTYFFFWMPERRYAERRIGFPRGGLTVKVCEHDRPYPEDDEYLIKFGYGPIPRVGASYIPAVRWPDKRGTGLSEYGLRMVISEKKTQSGEVIRRWKDYGHPVGYPYQIHFDCSRYYCSGHIYFVEEKLSIYIQFGKQYMSLWHTNLLAALEMLKSWEAATPETISDTELDQIISRL